MRIKRSRLNTFYLKKRISKKDKEGCSTEEWGTGVPFVGEQWPASGKVQVQQYGDRLNYILNLKLDGNYQIVQEKQGVSFDGMVSGAGGWKGPCRNHYGQAFAKWQTTSQHRGKMGR